MAIVAAESVAEFFGEVVEEALRTRRTEATEGATTYLVALLADYAHPCGRAGDALDRPVTLLFEEAMTATDFAERFERLRTLGDGVLYGCGFFGDHFEARGVDPHYVQSLGTRAYGAASSMLRASGTVPRRAGKAVASGSPDLFAELATNFDAFVDVLGEVADATVAMGADRPAGLIKAYERWLKTGSDTLTTALTSRGVIPTRGARGLVH